MLRRVRQRSAADAARRCQVLALLNDRTPRDVGSTIVYGTRRDVVNATVGTWIASVPNGDVHATTRPVPETASLVVRSSHDRIEVDLDTASSADTRAFFAWVTGTVRSRHCVHGTHVVVVYGADRADARSLKRLVSMPYAILVASTTRPDCDAIRSITGVLKVRAPCTDPDHVPRSAADVLANARVRGDVEGVREAVHTLRCMGFTTAEIARFAVRTFGRGRPVDSTAATLAYLAGAPGPDDRATETLVARLMCTQFVSLHEKKW